MNLKKSNLTSTQDLVYIGARFWMDMGRVYLTEEWINRLLSLVRSFSKVRQYKTALLFLSILAINTLKGYVTAISHKHTLV